MIKDDDLKLLLKMDVPDIVIDTKKILSLCESKKDPFLKRKISLCLGCFITLLIVVGFSLISVRLTKIQNINKLINNLSLIDNNQDKMLEIMLTDKEILKLTGLERNLIEFNDLDKEKTNTSHLLKTTVEWNEYMNKDVSYISLNEIYDYSNIDEYRVLGMSKNTNKYYQYIPKKKIFNDAFISMINIPYIDINKDYERGYIQEMLKKYDIHEDSLNSLFILGIEKDLTNIQYIIDPSGFVIIEETDYFYHKVINRYISLIQINYDNLLKLCNECKTKVEEHIIFGSIPNLKVNDFYCNSCYVSYQWFKNDDDYQGTFFVPFSVTQIHEILPNLQIIDKVSTINVKFELKPEDIQFSYYLLNDDFQYEIVNHSEYPNIISSILEYEYDCSDYCVDIPDIESNILIRISCALYNENQQDNLGEVYFNYYFIIKK